MEHDPGAGGLSRLQPPVPARGTTSQKARPQGGGPKGSEAEEAQPEPWPGKPRGAPETVNSPGTQPLQRQLCSPSRSYFHHQTPFFSKNAKAEPVGRKPVEAHWMTFVTVSTPGISRGVSARSSHLPDGSFEIERPNFTGRGRLQGWKTLVSGTLTPLHLAGSSSCPDSRVSEPEAVQHGGGVGAGSGSGDSPHLPQTHL